MIVLSSFMKACIVLAMYITTFNFALPVCYLTCLLKSYWLMFLYISEFLFKDSDRALIYQFVTIHGLHPTCKERTKKIF
jgi:hypothetical protein